MALATCQRNDSEFLYDPESWDQTLGKRFDFWIRLWYNAAQL
jgi:hypothetical protein